MLCDVGPLSHDGRMGDAESDLAGRKQHHIPRFLLRGFLADHSGRTEKVWAIRRSGRSYISAIEDVAAERDFYSKPSKDGSKTLDDHITDYEYRLADLVRGLRSIPIGEAADVDIVSEVIAHLAPRTRSLRALMARGLENAATIVAPYLESEDTVFKLFGLDATEPDDRFRGYFRADLEKLLIGAPSAPPIDFLERFAFAAVQEGFPEFFAQQLPQLKALTSLFAAMSKDTARTGHNRALSSSLSSVKRREGLRSFEWHICPAPAEGALLPDCVVVAAIRGDGFVPYLMSGGLEVDGIIFPLATDRLLVGTPRGESRIDIHEYNDAALSCSEEFVCCSRLPRNVGQLQERIGVRTKAFLDSAMNKAEEGFKASMAVDIGDDNAISSVEFGPHSGSLECELTLMGFDDADLIGEVSDAIKGVVSHYMKVAPLHRLDGITFAVDYESALRGLDRGYEVARPPQTVNEEVGTGHCQAVLILRGGVIKVRIVARAEIALALVGDDENAKEYALHILMSGLAETAFIEQLDKAFPGVLLRPYADQHAGQLFGAVYPAIVAYFAARGSAGFGADEYLEVLIRENILQMLDHIRLTVERERKAFEADRNVDRFYFAGLRVVCLLLCFCATLLGQRAALAEPLFAKDDSLSKTFADLGIASWLDIFRRDLDKLWARRGAWASFDQFWAMRLHAERVLWRMGIIPVKLPTGQTYVNFAPSAPLAPYVR